MTRDDALRVLDIQRLEIAKRAVEVILTNPPGVPRSPLVEFAHEVYDLAKARTMVPPTGGWADDHNTESTEGH